MFKRLLPRRTPRRWLGTETELEVEKHFTLVRRLGQGSYATVYQVRRHADGRSYALKVANIQALGPLEQSDVVNEIRLLASLDHPNLTTFYEAFFDQGRLCIVQELVAGGDLGSLIRKRAATGVHFSEAQVWTAFLQIAAGLQYLHHNHVLHRDLKPGNLLVTERGVVKLADLGISQVLDRVFTDTMIGTPHYMAPEMWCRQPYSYSADIWALGCVLHELCTLRPLFVAPTDEKTCYKVLAGVIPPISPRYSQDLRRLIAAMLAQHPAQRPTIDDILQLPEAQPHLERLPEGLQERCASPALSAERDHARLLQPIRLPRHSEEWDAINQHMPDPRYASGTSVSAALRSRHKSWSTGDLQALGASAEDVDGDREATPHTQAAEAATAMRKSQSYGALAAAVEARMQRGSLGLTRRRSVSVGEHLAGLPAEAGGGGDARHDCSGSLQATALVPVVEEAPGSVVGSPPPLTTRLLVRAAGAGWAAEGQAVAGEEGAARRLRSFRSKSLSVEDAVESLTSRQQQLQQQAAGQHGGNVPGAPAAAAPRPAAAGHGNSQPGLASQAAAGSASAAGVLRARPPLPAAPVTAQVQAGRGGKAADLRPAAVGPADVAQAAGGGKVAIEAAKQRRRKGPFWQHFIGGSKK